MIKEQVLPISSLPKNYEIAFIKDVLLNLLQHKKVK